MSITLPGGRTAGGFVGDAVLVVGFVAFGLAAGGFVGTVTVKKHDNKIIT